MRVYEYEFRRKKVAETTASVRTPHDVARLAAEMIGDKESEHLIVLLMNSKNKVIGMERVYVGNVSAALVRVGELFRAAIRLNACGIVLAHNHPSGEVEPSPEDLHLTAEVIAAGRLLDIAVLDHVIVAEGGAFLSLRDRGVAFSV